MLKKLKAILNKIKNNNIKSVNTSKKEIIIRNKIYNAPNILDFLKYLKEKEKKDGKNDL